MMENVYESQVQFATTAVSDMVEALSGGFETLIPVGLGVIALVLGTFWLIRRAKRFANMA